jgi:hypothetical protein
MNFTKSKRVKEKKALKQNVAMIILWNWLADFVLRLSCCSFTLLLFVYFFAG